jgi:hypothetical protein
VPHKSFGSFTVAELQQVDKLADQLLLGIDSLYRSKEIKNADGDKIKRCNSATLQRDKTNTKSFN